MIKVKVTNTNGQSYINAMYVYVGQILWKKDGELVGYYSYESDPSMSFMLPGIQTETIPA